MERWRSDGRDKRPGQQPPARVRLHGYLQGFENT
jgi:hypothetical protein